MQRLFQRFFWWVARCLLRLRYRVEVRGGDELRKLEGPTIVMPNHPGYIDPPLVLSHLRLRDPIRPLVYSGTYRNPVLFPVMWALGAVEVPELSAQSRQAKQTTLDMIGKVAEAVGRSRAAVSNLLRLLGLPATVRRMVEVGELEMGHARALLGLEGDVLLEAARKVAGKGMSVRETEALVRALLNKTEREDIPQKAIAEGSSDIRRLEDELSEKLGARVAIRCNHKGKGKVVIDYNSLDELDGILAHLQ